MKKTKTPVFFIAHCSLPPFQSHQATILGRSRVIAFDISLKGSWLYRPTCFLRFVSLGGRKNRFAKWILRVWSSSTISAKLFAEVHHPFISPISCLFLATRTPYLGEDTVRYRHKSQRQHLVVSSKATVGCNVRRPRTEDGDRMVFRRDTNNDTMGQLEKSNEKRESSMCKICVCK